MTKFKIVFSFLFWVSSIAQASYWVRTPNSSPSQFLKFLENNHYLSYMDWIEYNAPKTMPQAEHLDEALQLALTNPHEALAFFDQALASLQNEILTEPSRALYIAVCKKISELDLPKRIRDDYAKKS